MNDGGMGSILFYGSKGRSVGRVFAEAGYRDVDDVLVSLVVNLNREGQLFELDMWNVDFSALKREVGSNAVGAVEEVVEECELEGPACIPPI